MPVPSSYSSSSRGAGGGILYSNHQQQSPSSSDSAELIRLRRKVKQLEDNIEELNVMRESLDDELTKKNREITRLKVYM